MLTNSEEWTLGSQVRNQSVENGSMPLGGDTPLTSLYSLSRRSRERVVSDSRTCGRAPSSISSIASWVSRISFSKLFLLMALPSSFGGTAVQRRAMKSGEGLRGLARHQDGRMRVRDGAFAGVVGQHVQDDAVVETEARHHHAGSGELEDLRRRQRLDDVGDTLADAEAKDGRG